MARDMRTLLTTSEAAEALGVHPATIARWASQGQLEVVILPGGHRRIPAEEVARIREPMTVLAR